MGDRLDKDLFGREVEAAEPLPSDADEIAKIYRAMADGEPIREVMEMFYGEFGRTHGLRSPVDELRLVRLCGAEGSPARG
jgi:hypothetical protein